jgi:NADPH:quinone reductase-like Zn-dependent oxidoreductase
MYAAVVSSFDSPPRYEQFPTPEPSGQHESVVEVIAAGLHPRVRSQSDGSHYTSTAVLPLIPGIDGVGRTSDGELHYFILPDTTMGAMAEKTVVDLRRSVLLPSGSDPILVAALMNPAMSAWVALRQRISFRPGQSVLVLGATGSAGRLAIQVAKHLGASKVVAAGRGDPQRLSALSELGADQVVPLEFTGAHSSDPDATGLLGEAARDVDVVLDYVWGAPTANAMIEVVRKRTDRRKPLSWVEIGSVAGATAEIPSAALRAARLQIVGSGQGSVSAAEFLEELLELAEQITHGAFVASARAVALADVEKAWTAVSSDDRIVITPLPVRAQTSPRW